MAPLLCARDPARGDTREALCPAQRPGDRCDGAVPLNDGCFGDVDRVAVTDQEIARHEQAVGFGQVHHVDQALSAHQIAPAQNRVCDLCRLVAEHENAGRVCCGGAQTTQLGQGLDQRQGLCLEGHACLRARGPQRCEGALIRLDQNAVAISQRDVQLWAVIEILEPDGLAVAPARQCDLCNVGSFADTTGTGQHRGKRARRAGDRENPLNAGRAEDRHRRPVTGGPAHLDLWIGRLFLQLFGDQPANGLGRVARRLDAARIGHKDEPGPVDLDALERCGVRRRTGQQAVIHVFPHRQTQHVARTDDVGALNACILELFGKAQGGNNRRGPCHSVIDGNHERVAFTLDGACEDLVFRRANARQAARRNQ
mmetsp:Transcript_15100/g.49521  ORF Transcript_15100/g.49521 Transcript_15100/m.49521 type:complete len:369 (-) Transcript_15100:93-1199(-)